MLPIVTFQSIRVMSPVFRLYFMIISLGALRLRVMICTWSDLIRRAVFLIVRMVEVPRTSLNYFRLSFKLVLGGMAY